MIDKANLYFPWTAQSPSDSRSYEHDYWIEDSRGGCVGYFCGENQKWNLKKGQALLIASAPALLEALEEIVKFAEDYPHDMDFESFAKSKAKRAIAAIAAARGTA